jgi:hypothetical protein
MCVGKLAAGGSQRGQPAAEKNRQEIAKSAAHGLDVLLQFDLAHLLQPLEPVENMAFFSGGALARCQDQVLAPNGSAPHELEENR